MLDFLNHELQGQEYLAQQFSIADIGFVPRLVVLKDLGLDPTQNRPNVDAWLNRMIDRPSIQSLEGLDGSTAGRRLKFGRTELDLRIIEMETPSRP